MMPIQVTSSPQIRAFPKLNPNREQQKAMQGPAVTVFVGTDIFPYYLQILLLNIITLR